MAANLPISCVSAEAQPDARQQPPGFQSRALFSVGKCYFPSHSHPRGTFLTETQSPSAHTDSLLVSLQAGLSGSKQTLGPISSELRPQEVAI